MIKIAFLINRKIKDFSTISESIKSTFDNEFYIKRYKSEYSGHIIELTKLAIEEGFLSLIIVGGDGTINEVINGVFQKFKTESGYDINEISKVKISILPVGSGNDFTRTIKISKDIIKLFTLVRHFQK